MPLASLPGVLAVPVLSAKREEALNLLGPHDGPTDPGTGRSRTSGHLGYLLGFVHLFVLFLKIEVTLTVT